MAPLSFTQFYQNYYRDRWPALFQSLQISEKQTPRLNAFAQNPPSYQQGQDIPRSENGLLSYYVMDPASIIVAKALNVQSGDSVLDMCAAPGGKTLILAEALLTEGELIANEMSEGRRERLKKVIQQYIPRDVRDRVWVTGKDGGKFALTHKEKFDKILVDAPCSGERHLLQNKKELADWNENRTKKLAQRQYALLTAALLAAKPGGRIVYSTCALSHLENDGVIEKLLSKKEGQFELINQPVELAETTKYGQIFLPDVCEFGPMYFCVMKKREA